MKSECKKAGTLQLTGIRRIEGELLCVRDAGADAVDGGYLVRSMWILWMTSLSHTSASVTELSCLVTSGGPLSALTCCVNVSQKK